MSKSEIRFSSSFTLKSFEDFKWIIGNSYSIEFFDNILTPVILLNPDCDINEIIHAIPSDDIIFMDFEYLHSNQSSIIQDKEKNNIPKNCLFAFYYKSTVYICLQATSEVNCTIKHFLSDKNGLRFVGINFESIKEMLNLFGSNFSINFEDFSKAKLSSNGNESSESFYETITKYIEKPKIEIDFNHDLINCDVENLIIPKIITSSFKVLSLSLLYSKIPKPANEIVDLLIPKKNIQFSSEFTPEYFSSSWNVGESYNVEFFKDIFTPVYLIDVNSDLTEYLQKISKDLIIYIDLKSVQTYVYKTKLTPEEQKEVPYICCFSFCCSSGVYIFKQLTLTASDQLKKFLTTSQKDHKFVGINLESNVNKLQHFFGLDFSIKIEDVSKSRLSQKFDPTNFHDLVVKYYKKPEAEFKNKIIKNALWHKNPLSMTHIIYAAFKVFALSLCYPNFPPEKGEQGEIEVKKPIIEIVKKTPVKPVPEAIIYPILSPSEIKPQPEINKKGEIHFALIPDFNEFQKQDWPIGDSYDVEFFSGTLTPVVLLDAASDISEYISKMESESVVFFDLEYVIMSKDTPPICLFQFCCSSGAFLFKQTRVELNDQMKNFLCSKNGKKFVGKGVNGDTQRLREYFGEDFEMNLEDVEQTRLYSYEGSANFDEMVLKFAGQPESSFKDKKVSRSNWNAKTLSVKQVLYSAFDVVSLFKCFPSFPPIRAINYISPNDTITIDIKKKFREYLKDVKDENEFNSIWNLNPNLVAKMLEIDLNIVNHVVHESMRVTVGHKFSCKLCHKPVKCAYFISLINHYMKYHLCEEEKDPSSSNDQQINFKELFLYYLFNSGRIILENNSCILCDVVFNSRSEIENHCWNNHYYLLNEFLKINKIQNNNNNNNNNNNANDDQDNANEV